ncbi:MAG: SRPBCC family protein [Acidobacteria bacterium]|nr:SRPBCC family protein [Acidobacteriota bacterium]
MLKKILLTLVIVIVAILIFAATKPDTYRVERSISISAPPEKPFALIDDFHHWDLWSPWAHLDPNVKVTYSGPSSGKGAVYAWEGNSKVGAGRMEILDDAPSSHVNIKLDFFKPMQGTSMTDFQLTPEGNGTRVTWVMSGDMNYVSKVMCVFSSMDKMIGKDFEKGLQKMKTQAEK